MPTPRQQKLAQAIVENAQRDKPLNKKELLVSSGYSVSSAESVPSRVLEAEGVQDALEELGFSENNAKQVVGELLMDPSQDGNIRLNAAKEVFKVHGSYAPEKKITANVHVERKVDDEELETLRLEYEDKLRDKLIGS